MPSVRGCNLPDNLLYDVDNHTWFTEVGDGTVRIGMTAIATAMAGQLVAFTPKKIGRSVRAGRSCATVESGKWVGPAKSAAGGEVVGVNEELLSNPSLANQDPYAAMAHVRSMVNGNRTWACSRGSAGCSTSRTEPQKAQAAARSATS